MIKQTLNWTALPKSSNGAKQAGTELRLSVLVSPRLWNDDASIGGMPLSDFPDWLDWPALVGQASFQVEFDGGPTLAATPENLALRSDLWQALFKPTTTVKPFVFEDMSGVSLLSFPAATVLDTVTGVYQRAAIDPGWGGGVDLPGRTVLANDPDLSDIARPVEPLPPWRPPETDRGPVFVGEKEEPRDEDEGEEPDEDRKGCVGCLLLPFRLVRRLLRALRLNVIPLPLAAQPAAAAEDGRKRPETPTGAEAEEARDGEPAVSPPAASLAAASQQQAAFDQLHAYVQPHSPTSVELPSQSEIQDQYDFHQMIASLGDYPNLMRYMGLVVDLVVTLGSELPADQGGVRVTVDLPVATTTTQASPRTRYELGAHRFMARPRAGSELANGLLRLDDASRFRVAMTDVAGSGLKLQNTATNLRGMETLAAWPVNAPQEAGLPALQTAGISVVRREQTSELVRRFDHSFALNGFLSALDASPMPVYAGAGTPPAPSDELFAEDLVRGYRIDIHDAKAQAWHSLCRRVGDYEFLDGPLSLHDEEDEGFVQLASTESLEESPQRELKVHESLFGWDGWSLAAPRPGDTILADHTTGEVQNEAVTQFQLETSFRARPGSLPRLRFGWVYRVRARLVDLAGNSVFGPDDPEFGTTQPEATAPFQFDRYEAVAPPPLVLKASPIEGETIERLVVRSTIHDPPATITAQASERHVVPPKSSQQMVERHGAFDGSPGMHKDQAAYDLASREAASVTERMNTSTGLLEPIPGTFKEEPSPGRVYWLQTNDDFEVAYLPDPFARGVLLLGLPGMADPDDVVDGTNRIAFGGTWPDLEAFRLRLTALPAGAAPAAPAWDGNGRVLTVEVPQGETFRVRYCSYLHPADLEQMGVWQWVRQAAPANLADLEKQAVDGRNWLHLPFRELVLVHAVQQPLAIPRAELFELQPAKQVGDTAVTLGGQSRVAIDAKSTGKIDLRAAWTDPFDDPEKPAYDPLTDFVQRQMHVDEIAAEDPADDLLAIQDVVHTLGDTKYHRVTYAPIATTRHLEHFPPAVLANPADLVRPTAAEVGTPPALNARIEVDIPNSARPETVAFRYAVPVVHWSRSESAGVVTRVRRGGGLRIYMDRPWFSSGDKELLGAVLRPAKYSPLSADWKSLRKYVSEWGMDPIWRAEETAPLKPGDFVNQAAQDGGLTLEELPGFDVDAVGFTARYDDERNLWFADVLLDAERYYFPFVRLALARFHPISVADAHLSRVVLSDFVQVLPNRTVDYDLTQVGSNGLVQIRVHGPAYHQPQNELYASPLMIARLEQRVYDTGDELGWEVVTTAPLPAVQRHTAETIWEGRLQLPSPAPSPARIVVLEAEIHSTDPKERGEVGDGLERWIFPISPETGTSPGSKLAGVGTRIVFADAVELP